MFRLRVVPVELPHGVGSLNACGGQGHELGIRSRDPLAPVHLHQDASVLGAALVLLLRGVVRHISVQASHQFSHISAALVGHDQQGLNHAIQFGGQVVQVDGGSVKHGGFLWACGPVGFQVVYTIRTGLSSLIRQTPGKDPRDPGGTSAPPSLPRGSTRSGTPTSPCPRRFVRRGCQGEPPPSPRESWAASPRLAASRRSRRHCRRWGWWCSCG